MGAKPIKGNTGRARQSRLLKRVGTVLGACFGVIVVVEMAGVGRHSPGSRHRRRKGLRSLNPSLFKLRHSQQNDHGEEQTAQQRTLTEDQKIDLVLSASVHLVSIEAGRHVVEDPSGGPGQYTGITAEFCRLNWAAHKASPSGTPMFRDLVAQSPDCQDNAFRLDLRSIVAAAKKEDADVKRDATLAEGTRVDGVDAALLVVPRALYPPRGVVFHESRCGSTLVANALAAFDPDRNRVYSESAPPIAALRVCGEGYGRCTKATAAAVLRDVIYMMSRTDDPSEEHLFFKIQSIGTRFVEVFAEAFPRTPYIFVYRDPVQVMMSHLDHAHMENSNCVRPRSNPPKIVVDLVEGHGRSVTDLSHEEYCAAHLATLCDSALAEMKRTEDALGLPVNYKDLPEKLYEVIPNHFGVPIGDDEKNRIAEVSGVYSKGRGNRAHEWQDDSETKEERATNAIRGACSMFLAETFRELEQRAASASASAGGAFAEETR